MAYILYILLILNINNIVLYTLFFLKYNYTFPFLNAYFYYKNKLNII